LEPFFDFHGHSTEADRRRPIASFLKEAPPSPGGASAFSAFPIEKRGAGDGVRTGRGLLEIQSEPNDLFSTRYNAIFETMDDAAYGSPPMKFPKRDINARQKARQRKSCRLS
jgi:hypothetical protein